MKLWLLKPPSGWTPWYDKVFGFVIRAKDENAARTLASQNAADEGSDAWLDHQRTTCTELTAKGRTGLILRNFAGT